MNIAEKLFLTFSIKKCKLNDCYQIKIKSDSPTLEIDNSFETEKLRCQEEGMELEFKKALILNYRFNIKQKIQIITRREVYQDQSKNYILKEDIRNTILSSMVTSPNSVYERPLEKNENRDILSIRINGNPDNQNNSLFNYFKEGLKLSSFFSMDFSQGLNKLNIIDSKKTYLDFIKNIIDIISYYTKHNFFIYGYGASLNDKKKSNSIDKNIFNLNTKENEKVNYTNIFDKIKNFPYNNIIPKKKVVFSNMLKEITNEIFKINNDKYYNLLFIFAREFIEDNNIQETKNVLDEMETLPISIIVIYLGKNDFSKMNEFKNCSNKFMFIDFKNVFNESYKKAVEWSLGEIGKQIFDYYKSVNFKNISMSINSYNQSYVIYRSTTLSQKEIEEEKKEIEEDNKEYKEDKKENGEKIISKFYNFQKIHEEYKKKKESQIQMSSLKVNEIENNEQQINQKIQNNQNSQSIQNIQNNQNNGKYRLQASNKSEQNDNNSYMKNPYKDETNLLKQYNYITPSYNSNYNNNDINLNDYALCLSKVIPNQSNVINKQNEKKNRNTYQDDNVFPILNK